ncbi:PhzF family phenazine biosynthesis protein [Chryseobacterium cucumeris]|uniref:PhzF family phenazine biosynthesis protein n=1 Tax=Chryseobacterium cucumeris TaxID=1813611 RepID=UPI00192D5521|nr:PhzF family phenazine biosynthesis protein [Chryseobacterium cucumeris]QRA45025.1 PhzF family phenazine biosynthesis protein [Chryseobacterium cucumeris]
MKLELYQIDAFTESVFHGNPACVVPLKNWLPDEILLKIARENAVAETAFFIDNGDSIHLRWFTPEINLDPGGVIVTSEGTDSDFVSRYFTPQSSILEDPVTGSAHCSLIPFWSSRLGKDQLFARQISERGGQLYCENKKERVIVAGKAQTYSVGHFRVE